MISCHRGFRLRLRFRACGPQVTQAGVEMSFDAMGAITQAVGGAITSAFPSAAVDRPLITVVGASAGNIGFCADCLADGMMVVYRNCATTPGDIGTILPVRLGRILRLVDEVAVDVYAVVESWWPLKKTKNGGRLNMFGTWIPGTYPRDADSGHPGKRQNVGRGPQHVMVRILDILVWPIDCESHKIDFPDGVWIPLEVFHYLRMHCDIDLSHYDYSWSKRGRSFYMEVIKHVGDAIRQQQQNP